MLDSDERNVPGIAFVVIGAERADDELGFPARSLSNGESSAPVPCFELADLGPPIRR